MKLTKLRAAIAGCIIEDSSMNEMSIHGLQINSSQVKPGEMFIAISGHSKDGHEYIQDAIDRGAKIIIGEKPLHVSVPYIQVGNSRIALAKLASAYYEYPIKKHRIIGITGTNGKTTISYMLRHILTYAGKTCSLLGTISYIINDEAHAAINTTPDSLKLQELLAKSKDEFVVMEVSSHAIEQSRIEGLRLDYGLFTNLAHDHLDYHFTMEKYFSVKEKMFSFLHPEGQAIINTIDQWGERLAAKLQRDKVKTKTIAADSNGDLQIIDRGCGQFVIELKGKTYPVNLSLPGIHNCYNAAMSILTCYEAGIPIDTIISALSCFKGVPGRFEMAKHPEGANFVVDYAHTEDAIDYCLKTARDMGAQKITHIFGFRGGRDESKRGKMLQTSVSHSDQIYLTIDDLNGVPLKTMVETLEKLKEKAGNSSVSIIADRTAAIQKAWQEAHPGDWVLITGKGPEKYKEDFVLPVCTDMEAIEYLKNETGGRHLAAKKRQA